MHSSLSSSEMEVECQRKNLDRRNHPTRALHGHGIKGRRKDLRREEDLEKSTDWFETHVMLVSLSIALFCIMDFILTSIIIGNGGVELNLLVRETINMGMESFFIYKYSLTCLSLILLVAHENHRLFRLIKVKHILYCFSASYLMLLCYEVYLLFLIF